MPEEKTVVCQLTQKRKRMSEVVPAVAVRPNIVALIKKDYPDFSGEGYVSKEALKKYRREYIEQALSQERGDLSGLEQEVVKSMVEHETLAKDPEAEYAQRITFGQHLADGMASFGGSWTFILIFAAMLVVWITINTVALLSRPFDPYPYILLNLILSCLAAIQAPVIMMSQNRKEAKDRLRAENDYKVNLKAELEIRHLHEKIDFLTQKQWQRLLEIQQLQLDLMEERTREEDEFYDVDQVVETGKGKE